MPFISCVHTRRRTPNTIDVAKKPWIAIIVVLIINLPPVAKAPITIHHNFNSRFLRSKEVWKAWDVMCVLSSYQPTDLPVPRRIDRSYTIHVNCVAIKLPMWHPQTGRPSGRPPTRWSDSLARVARTRCASPLSSSISLYCLKQIKSLTIVIPACIYPTAGSSLRIMGLEA